MSERADAWITERVADVSAERIREHVEALAAIGPRPGRDRAAHDATVAYVVRTLAACGVASECEVFDRRRIEGPMPDLPDDADALRTNVLVASSTDALPILEIGAHHDTVPGSPGADDNASAVAGLLEIARVTKDAPLARGLRFLFLADEEFGFCGSRHHVKRVTAGERGDVRGFVSLEMIGYTSNEPDSQRTPVRVPLVVDPPRTGDFLAIVGRFGSVWLGRLIERAAAAYVPELRTYSMKRLGGFLGDAARSDHSPYWDAGLPAVMLTDTADFRNPHYHRPSDLPATLDYEFAAGVTRATTAAALVWASRPPD